MSNVTRDALAEIAADDDSERLETTSYDVMGRYRDPWWPANDEPIPDEWRHDA